MQQINNRIMSSKRKVITGWASKRINKTEAQNKEKKSAEGKATAGAQAIVPHHAVLADDLALLRGIAHHRPHSCHVAVVLSVVTLRVILLDTGQISNTGLLVERALERRERVELLHAYVSGFLLRPTLVLRSGFCLLRCRWLVVVVDADGYHRFAGIGVAGRLEQATLKDRAFLFEQGQFSSDFVRRGLRYCGFGLGFRAQLRFSRRLDRRWTRGVLLRPFWNRVRKRRAAPSFRTWRLLRWLGICACS